MSQRGKYTLHKINPTSFKKGHIPRNKGEGKPLEGDKECPICHKVFHYKRTYYNNPPKTCSKECRYKSCSITGTHHIYKKCIVCGKEFQFAPSVEKDRATIFCSKKCKKSSTIRYSEETKDYARMLVTAMVKQGTLKKLPCEVCGELIVHAHHGKGYKPENWAIVTWLCVKHHAEEHARLRRTGESLLL